MLLDMRPRVSVQPSRLITPQLARQTRNTAITRICEQYFESLDFLRDPQQRGTCVRKTQIGTVDRTFQIIFTTVCKFARQIPIVTPSRL